MTAAFSVAGREPLAELGQDALRHVLVTGAAGNIGAYFAAHAHRKYRLRLMVLEDDDA